MKRFLLAGALSLIGLAPSLVTAQVTSINSVGYVNINCAPGFTMISNPLSAQDVSIPALFSSLPDGVRVFKFVDSTFVNQRKTGGAWTTVGGTNLTLYPGEGAFVSNPFSTNLPVTFVGEVETGNLSNPIPVGFSVRSAQVPQEGGLASVHGLPVGDGDLVYRLVGGSYVLYRYRASSGWTGLGEPVIEPAEAFWMFRQNVNGAVNWTRSFSVN